MLNLNKFIYILLLTSALFLSGCQTTPISNQDITWNKQNSLYLFEDTLANKLKKLEIDEKLVKDTIYIQLDYLKDTTELCRRQDLLRHLKNAILKSKKFNFLLPLNLLNKKDLVINEWILTWRVKEKDGYCDWQGDLKNDLYNIKLTSSYSKLIKSAVTEEQQN